jgi:ankyrin repeat protein
MKKELRILKRHLSTGSYEEQWQALSAIAKIELKYIDFKNSTRLRGLSRRILNEIALLLNQEFTYNHPYIKRIKRVFASWNDLVNTDGREIDGVAIQLNVHDARLSPIRKKGRDYLDLYVIDADKILTSETWLASYREVLNNIIKKKPALNNYMNFLYEQEEVAYKHSVSHHLGVSKALVKAWHLSQNKHGEDQILDINLIISALIDSSKAYEGGSGVFPGLPYSCHPGTQERIEEAVGVFSHSFITAEVKTDVEQYSATLSTYVSLYFGLLGEDLLSSTSEEYGDYTLNLETSRYISYKSAFYRHEDENITGEEIIEKIYKDLFDLHAPVSEGFLFTFMFGKDEKEIQSVIKDLIDNCIDLGDMDPVTQTEIPINAEMLKEIPEMEQKIGLRVKSVEDAHIAVIKAGSVLSKAPEPIYTRKDEFVHLFNGLGQKRISFRYMNSEIYKKHATYIHRLTVTNMPYIVSKPECFRRFLAGTEYGIVRKFDGSTPLHVAIKENPEEALTIFLQSNIPMDRKMVLLNTKDFTGNTPLCYCATAETLSALLSEKNITLEEKINLLSTESLYDKTVLSRVIANDSTALNIFLESDIELDIKMKLLEKKDLFGKSLLFDAIEYDPSEALLGLFKSNKLSLKNKTDLLMAKDKHMSRPLDLCLKYNSIAALSTFLDLELDCKTKMELLMIKENKRSLLYVAAKKNPSRMLTELFKSNISLGDKIELLKMRNLNSHSVLDRVFRVGIKGASTFFKLDFSSNLKTELLHEPDEYGMSISDRFLNTKGALDLLIEAANNNQLELKFFNNFAHHYALFFSGEWHFLLRVLLDMLMRACNWCFSFPKISNYFRSSPKRSDDIAKTGEKILGNAHNPEVIHKAVQPGNRENSV